jgi:hypothetical protein
VIEEEYGKSLQKLARSTAETYAANDGKAGTFVTAWQNAMRIHETMGENRLRFANRLNEMSEELASLAKEVDKNRKQVRRHAFACSVGYCNLRLTNLVQGRSNALRKSTSGGRTRHGKVKEQIRCYYRRA